MSSKKELLLAKKAAYFERLIGYLGEYSKCVVVQADNVGSHQFAQVRKELRGTGQVLMGKNTLMRKAFNMFLEANPEHPYGGLVPLLKTNVGLIFTNGALNDVRETIKRNVIPAAARAGAVSPIDVYVPAGPTGADPGKTNYFQAMNIPTKIVRGQIEIINDVLLVKVGEKVNAGSADLLKTLDIRPFFYGLELVSVYENGSIFDPAVLDLTDDSIRNSFLAGVRAIAAVGLTIGYPTLASVPHSLTNALKRLVCLCMPEDVTYTFEKAEPFLEYLANPAAFGGGGGGGAATGAPAAAAAVEEEEEEEDEEVGAANLFGDSSEDDDDSDSD